MRSCDVTVLMGHTSNHNRLRIGEWVEWWVVMLMEAFSSDSNTCHYQFDESFLIFPCFKEVEQDYNHISLHINPWFTVLPKILVLEALKKLFVVWVLVWIPVVVFLKMYYEVYCDIFVCSTITSRTKIITNFETFSRHCYYFQFCT